MIWDIKVVPKKVKILPLYDEGANWEYVFVRGAWHMHQGKLCDKCLLMAEF